MWKVQSVSIQNEGDGCYRVTIRRERWACKNMVTCTRRSTWACDITQVRRLTLAMAGQVRYVRYDM
jgi:hypothetical protein